MKIFKKKKLINKIRLVTETETTSTVIKTVNALTV